MKYILMTLMSIFAITFAGCGDKDEDTADAAVVEPADAGEGGAEEGDAGSEEDSGDAGSEEDSGDAGSEESEEQDGGSEDE